jgi:hypothetical protein
VVAYESKAGTAPEKVITTISNNGIILLIFLALSIFDHKNVSFYTW